MRLGSKQLLENKIDSFLDKKMMKHPDISKITKVKHDRIYRRSKDWQMYLKMQTSQR